MTVIPIAAQRSDHVGGDREICTLHADFMIDDRHDRSKRWMRPKELVLGRRLADRDRNDAGGASAFNARKIAPQRAEFALFFVELFLSRVQLSHVVGGRGGFLMLWCFGGKFRVCY